MASSSPDGRLRRELGLLDVFAISTGAMFSSGFFLLPGLAYATAGAWMVLAYGLSALLVIPAMLSKAELASALPRAGGTYYYLDRSMGPLVGTIGGLGTWVAMGLKNTFALIGVGAYLTLFLDVPRITVALGLALAFTALNIIGTKETARLQRWLVYALVGILLAFVVAGVSSVLGPGFTDHMSRRLSAAPSTDVDGVLATVGLVFVSYAGLTKVSGVAEEVIRPDRNILLGMKLSLGIAAAMYVLGTAVLVAVVPPSVLAGDLTPIATAAETVFGVLPGRWGVALVVVAAVAAFASTANAGIMSASRYLLAMGRDRLVGTRFRELGRFQTPTPAVLATGGFVVVALLTLDVISVAKLASAFQLLMFALVNLAVIVMRESRIETYDPAVKSPLYPWVQLVGIFLSLAMVVEMGRMPMLFTLALVAGCVVWYFVYAQDRVVRRGAVLHWFERLGRDRFDALETELWTIVKETGLRAADPLEDVVRRAPVLQIDEAVTFDAAARLAADRLSADVDIDSTAQALRAALERGLVPVSGGATLAHVQLPGVHAHELLLVRAPVGVEVDCGPDHPPEERHRTVHALLVLASPEADAGQHLRMVAHLATMMEQPNFLECWLAADNWRELRQLLTDDALTRFARRLTKELRDPSRRGWHPHSHPGLFESILVVDPTGAIDPPALELAERLAASSRAQITLAEPMDYVPRRALSDEEIERVEHSAHAQRLAAVAAELRERGVAARSLVLPGKPWLETVREVLRGSHDLVVVEGGEPPGMSSEVLHLLRKCPCPVWVVRAARPRVRRVLAAVDVTAVDADHRSLNELILSYAVQVTSRPETELHIVHAWRPGRAPEGGDWRADYARRLEDLLKGHGLDQARTHIHIVEGEPAKAIIETIGELDVDLVIMGTVCRTAVAGLLIGNTAETVLREVPCGVLALKPAGFVTPVRLG